MRECSWRGDVPDLILRSRAQRGVSKDEERRQVCFEEWGGLLLRCLGLILRDGAMRLLRMRVEHFARTSHERIRT
jgi:hypothetical protein